MRILFTLAVLSLALGCSTPRTNTTTNAPTEVATPAPAPTFAGDWEVTVEDTPAGTVNGTLSLMEDNGEWSGTFASGGSTIDMETVRRTDDGLMVQFYSSEYQTDVTINLRGEPGDEMLEGDTLGMYTTTARRKM